MLGNACKPCIKFYASKSVVASLYESAQEKIHIRAGHVAVFDHRAARARHIAMMRVRRILDDVVALAN